MKISLVVGAALAAAVAVDAHTLNLKNRAFQTTQQFLDARDDLEELSGIKLPRMNGLRGDAEKAYIEKEGLLEVSDTEHMTEEMKEKAFISAFAEHLAKAEAEGKWGVVGQGISQLWDNVTQVFDQRFDAYTRAMAVLNKIASDSWTIPTALDIKVPTTRTTHPKNSIPLVEGVEVPQTDESQGDVTSISDFVNSALAPDVLTQTG